MTWSELGRSGAVVGIFLLIAALLVSCCEPPPPTPASPGYWRWSSPYGFGIRDPHGNWACVMKDDAGHPTHIVAGLASASDGEGVVGYPGVPRVLGADPLEVPILPGSVVSVPAKSPSPLLVVTSQGYDAAPLRRPLPELATALWELEAERGTVRQVISGP